MQMVKKSACWRPVFAARASRRANHMRMCGPARARSSAMASASATIIRAVTNSLTR
jgi:hypothetical protein